MTNLIETTTAATRKALHELGAAACGLLATLAGGFQPGEAHLAGATCEAAAARSSTLDEDLEVLLHEIERRRARA